MERHGGDHRGSAATRRASKSWLLSPDGGHDWGTGWLPFGGDGTKVPCFWCQAMLTFDTVERDRIIPGGSYARPNLIPSCGPCNKDRSDYTILEYARVIGLDGK